MAVHIELPQGNHKVQLLKLAMSGASGDAGAAGDWVLVAVPPAAASGAQPAANSQLPDDATVATAATAATVPGRNHEEAVARGQLMAATASAGDTAVRPPPRRRAGEGAGRSEAERAPPRRVRLPAVAPDPAARKYRARQVAALPRPPCDVRGAALPEQPGRLLRCRNLDSTSAASAGRK